MMRNTESCPDAKKEIEGLAAEESGYFRVF